MVSSKPKLNHSGSAPNLASDELNQPSSSMAEAKTKPKGLKKIWGKMRRSNSGNFQDEKVSYRGSEGSRFSSWLNSVPNTFIEPAEPFEKWGINSICAWLDTLGLGLYAPEVRKVCQNGQELQSMTVQDLEIKLGVKNGLHRKKLLLAIKERIVLLPMTNS